MKPAICNITEEQKAKLLEMTNTLFPKHHFRIDEYRKSRLRGEVLMFYLPVKNAKRERIHWFELCMTHLAYKIFFPSYSEELNEEGNNELKQFLFDTFINKMEDSIYEYEHPIDYLYTKFQKQNPTL